VGRASFIRGSGGLVTRLARSSQTLSISSEEEHAFELATSMASRRRVLIPEYSNARP